MFSLLFSSVKRQGLLGYGLPTFLKFIGFTETGIASSGNVNTTNNTNPSTNIDRIGKSMCQKVVVFTCLARVALSSILLC